DGQHALLREGDEDHPEAPRVVGGEGDELELGGLGIELVDPALQVLVRLRVARRGVLRSGVLVHCASSGTSSTTVPVRAEVRAASRTSRAWAVLSTVTGTGPSPRTAAAICA